MAPAIFSVIISIWNSWRFATITQDFRGANRQKLLPLFAQRKTYKIQNGRQPMTTDHLKPDSQPASQPTTTESQPAENQSQSQSQNETYLDSDDGSDLRNYKFPDLDDDHETPDAMIKIGGAVEDETGGKKKVPLIDSDAFFTVFQSAFIAPGMVIPDLQELAITSENETVARGASDAVYELLKIYYPPALTPQSETIGYLIVAGPFFAAQAMIVRDYFRFRRAKQINRSAPAAPAPAPAAPAPAPATANDNYPLDYVAIEIPQGRAA